MLNVYGGPFTGDGVFVAEDEDTLISAKEAVNVFEFAIRGFRVESTMGCSLTYSAKER